MNSNLKKWMLISGSLILNTSYLLFILLYNSIDENLPKETQTKLVIVYDKIFMIMTCYGIALITGIFSKLKRNVITVTCIYYFGLGTVFFIDLFINFITETKFSCYVLSITIFLCVLYFSLLALKSRSSTSMDF